MTGGPEWSLRLFRSRTTGGQREPEWSLRNLNQSLGLKNLNQSLNQSLGSLDLSLRSFGSTLSSAATAMGGYAAAMKPRDKRGTPVCPGFIVAT